MRANVSMQRLEASVLVAVVALLAAFAERGLAAESGDGAAAVKEAKHTVADFRQADPGLSRFLDGAVGYAVFPQVGKGGVVVGGAYGSRRARTEADALELA